MKEKNRIEKIAYCCFYLGLLIELAIVILDKSDWQNIYETLLFRLTFCLFGIKVLCTRYTIKEYLFLALSGLVALATWRISGKDELVRFVAFAAACRDIPVKQMMKTVFRVTAAGCVALILLSVTGIFGNVSLTLDFGRGMEQTRYCLGMGHPNALHCMMLMLMVLGLYLYYQKLNWWGYLLLFAANIGVYLLTDSRIGTVIGVCTVVFAAMLRYLPGLFRKWWVYAAGALVLIALPAMSAWLTVHYHHGLDRLINMRLWHVIVTGSASAANWKLFADQSANVFFDMGFVRLFYWYGIIPGICIVGVMAALCLWAGKEKHAEIMFLLICCAAYSIAEAHLVSVYIGRNYPMMLFGCSFSSMLTGKRGRSADWAISDLLHIAKKEKVN